MVFTSDNGGERFSDNWPLVGGKMDLTEGGIRVPWIAHWPAAIAPGSDQRPALHDHGLVGHDAGRCAACPPHPDYPLDGCSLHAGAARCRRRRFERPLFWRMNHRGQRALREGDWKYLRVDGNDYLFDLSQDERERANRAPREPERLAGHARGVGGLERDDAADSGRRHGQPGLFRQGHAATLNF